MQIEIEIPDDLVEYYVRGDGGPDRQLDDKLKELIEVWCRAMVNQSPGLADPVRRKLYRQFGLSIEDDDFL